MYHKGETGKRSTSKRLRHADKIESSSDLYEISDNPSVAAVCSSLSDRGRLMPLRRNYFLRKILKCVPKKRHFRGSWLHRVLGEGIFNTKLWGLHRDEVARGLALGMFIALTPTLGIQMGLTAIIAFILRVNIPIAVAACWITNPVSAPFIYGLQYKLGVMLVGVTEPPLLHGYTGVMKNMMRHARPLWVGSLVSGMVAALLSYGAVFMGWKTIKKTLFGTKEETLVPNSPPRIAIVRRNPSEKDRAEKT